jgi:LmbE family N-acetylglucosaminyl deacetylase
MLGMLRQYLRRGWRGLWQGRLYPLLLPHCRVTDDGLAVFSRPPQAMPSSLCQALRHCDGTRSLSRICGETGIKRRDLLALRRQQALILWPRPVAPDMAQPRDVRHIIISPHPDDALLCMGGLMLQQPPGSTLVIDVFTQTAWTRFPTELNDVRQIAAVRRSEDRCALRLCGAALCDAQLPEALLRDHLYANVFTDPPAPWDQEVMAGLAPLMSLAARWPAARWYLPLSVGNHLDHRIVRDTAATSLRQQGLHPRQLRYYEDLPYAVSLPGIPDFAAAMPGHRLVPQCIDIHRQIRWKLEAARAYWSQFANDELYRLEEYAQRIGHGRAVERVWRLAD